MIYIWVRATLDWKDEALVAARLYPKFRQKVAMWNATFAMPYHAFRQRLKEIAAANLARVERAKIVALDEVPAGALVVPVDDDDWFAPDLCQRLEQAFEPGLSGYYWIRNMLEAPEPKQTLKGWLRARQPLVLGPNARQGRHICGTNNYAVANDPGMHEVAKGHMAACRFFDENPARVKRLPLTLSLQNRNLSSRTALAWQRPTISREELLRAHRRYCRLYSRVQLAEGLAWAASYIDEVGELTRELTLVD